MADLRLAAAAATPLGVGVMLPVEPVLGGPPLCPFRAATGIPCPLCGATRAFVLAGHGDGRWIDYGAVWVVAAVALAVLALARVPRLRPLPSALGVGALAWAWAVAHADTIS